MNLSPEMRKIIAEQRLGFAATVCPDGSPNLSPKGTFTLLPDGRLAFADLRSPATIRNLRINPRIEVNFVDPFTRKGLRCSGRADAIIGKAEPEFQDLAKLILGEWPALIERVRHIVMIAIDKAALIESPAYDMGETIDELRAHWTAHFRALQPGGEFVRTE